MLASQLYLVLCHKSHTAKQGNGDHSLVTEEVQPGVPSCPHPRGPQAHGQCQGKGSPRSVPEALGRHRGSSFLG